MKRWMRKYREQGEFGLLGMRGRRKEYLDQERYVKQLKRENTMLKKCLEICMREVRKNASISSSERRNPNNVKSSEFQEADTTQKEKPYGVIWMDSKFVSGLLDPKLPNACMI